MFYTSFMIKPSFSRHSVLVASSAVVVHYSSISRSAVRFSRFVCRCVTYEGTDTVCVSVTGAGWSGRVTIYPAYNRDRDNYQVGKARSTVISLYYSQIGIYPILLTDSNLPYTTDRLEFTLYKRQVVDFVCLLDLFGSRNLRVHCHPNLNKPASGLVAMATCIATRTTLTARLVTTPTITSSTHHVPTTSAQPTPRRAHPSRPVTMPTRSCQRP